MTHEQTNRLQHLITVYGNASFDCGSADGEVSNYREIHAKAEVARATLKLFAQHPTRIFTNEDIALEVERHTHGED